MSNKERLHELDGIRGWAAFVVLIFHLSWCTFGNVHTVYTANWLKMPMDGGLAVLIFFVLSGDALSYPYLSTMRTSYLDRVLLKRYFRLSLPIFISCLAVYVLMKARLTYNAQAGMIVHSVWLENFIPFRPSLFGLLQYSLCGVFFNNGIQIYDPFLWPMGIELLGSVILFGYLYLFKRLSRPMFVNISLILLF
ncbi:MAG: acyltransferase family protein, partial [Syntrophobacteraceae bacterium]